MKQDIFKMELNKRLSENKKLSDNPGLGRSVEGVSSFVGLHFFWVLVFLSLAISIFWVRNISLEEMGNSFLFGWLYGGSL